VHVILANQILMEESGPHLTLIRYCLEATAQVNVMCSSSTRYDGQWRELASSPSTRMLLLGFERNLWKTPNLAYLRLTRTSFGPDHLYWIGFDNPDGKGKPDESSPRCLLCGEE
jgi:hypothetical protein